MSYILFVEITWPDDPERGSEHYGPFNSEEEQMQWVERCREAADLGWLLLRGARYLVTRLDPPFNPFELAQDAMEVTYDGPVQEAQEAAPEA